MKTYQLFALSLLALCAHSLRVGDEVKWSYVLPEPEIRAYNSPEYGDVIEFGHSYPADTTYNQNTRADIPD